MNKRFLYILILLPLFAITFIGCSSEKSIDKIKDIEFTVVEDKDIPKELKDIIEKKKQSEFRLTYNNEQDMYLVRGYGAQSTSGYSIKVQELFLAEDAIYLSTELTGASQQDLVSQVVSYPYIVVKIEFMDKSVIFN